jgi:Flp pilus assembly protein TadD
MAIEQGERSVALDTADAETWLILGAAYMQRGKYAQARRCFSSCVQLAQRGARSECAALLR